MASYRYLAFDLRTNALLGELPLAGVSYGHLLNGAGPFGGSMDLAQRTLSGTRLSPVLLASSQPARTALYVERDGVLVWGGIVWGRPQPDGRIVGITGAEFWSYFRRRRLRSTLTYAAADQFAIARGLIDWAQTQPGGDIGVVTGAATCGVLRDRTYWHYERGEIGQLVEQLAAVDNGFDFAIDVTYSAGVPLKTLRLNYPRAGRIAGTTGLVFEEGRNLSSVLWPEDGARAANSIDALGAGEGDQMLIATATRTDLIDVGYPLLDDTVSRKSVSVAATLAEHAQAAVDARAYPVTTTRLVDVNPSGDPPIGSWIMGDDARVRVPDSDRWPSSAGAPGLDRYLRIIADTVQVADEGVETVTITCGEVPSA